MVDNRTNLPEINFKIDFDFDKIFNKIKCHFKGEKRGHSDTSSTEIKHFSRHKEFEDVSSKNISSKNILPNIINKLDFNFRDTNIDEDPKAETQIHTKNENPECSKFKFKFNFAKEVDSLIGVEGLKKYHYEFKNYTKISKIISNTNKDKSPSRRYLSVLEKFNLTPKPSGIIRKNQDYQNSLNLNNFSLGDSYTTPLSEIIKESKSLKKIKIAQNRITNPGISKLMNNISNNINVLDLSSNNLSKDSYTSIAKLLSNTSQK